MVGLIITLNVLIVVILGVGKELKDAIGNLGATIDSTIMFYEDNKK